MNIVQMKSVVEVARLGSINQASETLHIAQPNLSRMIKELEAEFDIRIFNRTTKGMQVTIEGEEFVHYAKRVLKQISEIENHYKKGYRSKQRFSIAVPRASYISDAFANFSLSLTKMPVEIFYKETNSLTAIKDVISNGYNLGIIRYAEMYDKNFKEELEEKGLAYEMVAEFKYMLVMNKYSKLASLDEIGFDDLKEQIEIAHADPYVPFVSMSAIRKAELPDETDRVIYVYERGGQFDLLSNNDETFMWVSPLPESILKKHELVQRKCKDNNKVYKDLLIYRKDYKLSKLDKIFITELSNSKRMCVYHI